MTKPAAIVCLAFIPTLLAGCVTESHPAAPGALINAKPETATVSYWAQKPATVSVTDSNYDRLWDACDTVSHQYLFAIDRTDYRNGVMTTRPLVSKYLTEFWRSDVVGVSELADSTLAVYRRTIRYEIATHDDQHYSAVVKVVVERSSTFDRRMTTAIQYRDAFSAPPPGTEFHAEDGSTQPFQTWYAVGRDPALEEAIGRSLQATLK